MAPLIIINLISYFFYALFFFVPLVLFPKTSEIFEFNKIVLIYTLTTVTVSFWIIRMLLSKKVIFKRTFLDIPLLLFLASQLLSTITSIDTRTSVFGYYSRFHGGLLSSLSYALLYWTFVSNMNKQRTKKVIYVLLVSSFIVSFYAILQHLGIDKNIWVQNVQDRVFSTLGQPNWLAAFLTAAIPLVWALLLSSKRNPVAGGKNLKLILLSSLFFLIILYTKSRSGLLGFVFADFVFWIPTFIYYFISKEKLIYTFRTFITLHLVFFAIAVSVGTAWSPSVLSFFKQPSPTGSQQKINSKESVVEGLRGPESGKIRLIVWRGAYNIFKNNPLTGFGVETFAYSYYKFKPKEHNLTSEWDFLYNKAHNEYLNFAATSGVVGLSSYLILIIASLYQIANFKLLKRSHRNFKIALLSGYASILVTNLFGFSVAPTALLFFLYPAMAVTLEIQSSKYKVRSTNKASFFQKAGISLTLLLAFYLLLNIFRYWYADYLYARGKDFNNAGSHQKAQKYLEKAIELSPNEPNFWAEMAESKTKIAIEQFESANYGLATETAKSSINDFYYAISLSPNNVNIRKSKASSEIVLSELDSNYLFLTIKTLTEASQLAPTDAKIHYNLAIAQLKTGELDKATEILKKAINLKPNYKDARFALAVLQESLGNAEEAKNQLEYILNYLDPNDEQVILKLNQILK